MKTEPMQHQTEGLQRMSAASKYYALGAEQGTGKTWMLLADAERQFAAGRIDALLVIAPKGVHVNWVKREIPAHLECDHTAAFWMSGATKAHERKIAALMRSTPGDELVVLTINIDALNTAKGYDCAMAFVKRFRTMVVVDESHRIKNVNAKRTKRVKAIGDSAHSRRIASGTLIANNPLDLYSQYDFLRPGLLGTTSYRAFVAEYAELLPDHHPIMVEATRRARGKRPQLVARDHNGNERFRNLSRLRSLIAPHTFRVLKEDCLDLPDKIYQTQYFDLLPKQRALYDKVRQELRFERDDGEIDIFNDMTLITKLRQLTSGFLLVDNEPVELANSKPRMDALEEVLQDVSGQVIVWASFREELKQIAARFSDVVQYHGGIGHKERERAVDSFQAGEARIFLGNPAAAGVGLTLTNAGTAIYYSCSYSMEERLQSEDRCHRIGTKKPVVYIDLVARDTIDEVIASRLQNKQRLAALVMEDL